MEADGTMSTEMNENVTTPVSERLATIQLYPREVFELIDGVSYVIANDRTCDTDVLNGVLSKLMGSY